MASFNFIQNHYIDIVACEALSIENGQVKCKETRLPSGEYPVDAQVHFECNRGYDLSGSDSSTCQSSGLWNNQPPTCDIGNII